ncbi:hypothetical protein RhiirC2_769751 [Rhizophagus irregularis]|uniref:RRM domain-containing protein n=1 Tax=Rhizophagus irregularis TaxID=588596 RepID=A0A2N1NYC1_9GLOM|nr:hypothetical protein RhiirC2_769751 [Rhizophagus irregularis]
MAFFFLSSAIVVWFVDHADHADYVIKNNESNQAATSDKKNLDVDASLFIRNLDPDPDTGDGKGYGFISCDNFDFSDAEIDAMNGQYLMNKPITVSYAFKKDGKGERHGSAAERLLAAQAKKIKNLCLQMFEFAPSPRQINTGMSRPGISPPIVLQYGGYHAPRDKYTNNNTTIA